MEIGNTEIIKKFVNAGLCFSVLPYFTIKENLERKELCKLSIKNFSMQMYSQIFYHKNKKLTPIMSEFLSALNEIICT